MSGEWYTALGLGLGGIPRRRPALLQPPMLLRPRRRVSGAFVRTFLSSGNTSSIFMLEDDYVTANGGASLDALVPLVASISYLTE